MTRSALWQQDVTYPAQLDRQLMNAIWLTPGPVVGMMAVATSTGRGVTIAPGSAVVALGGGQGSALAYSDAIETASFPAAPASGTNRIDLLVVQIHDQILDAGSTNGFTFDVVVGVPGTAAVAPAVPARALMLASVYSHGGQVNLAPVDITMAPVATVVPPPLPAPPLPVYGGNLGGTDVTVPNGSTVTVMATPALPPGTYIVTVNVLAYVQGGELDVAAIVNSGAVTTYGSTAAMGNNGNSAVLDQRTIPLAFVAVVTSTAVRVFQATNTGPTSSTVKAYGTHFGAVATTAWSAVRVGN